MWGQVVGLWIERLDFRKFQFHGVEVRSYKKPGVRIVGRFEKLNYLSRPIGTGPIAKSPAPT